MYRKYKAYNTITTVYCTQTINVCTGGIYIETIIGIHLIVANSVEYGSVISWMYCKYKAYNTITAVYCLQTINVCAGSIHIETIGGICLIIANCVEYSGIISRMYCKDKAYNTITAVYCLQTINVCTGGIYIETIGGIHLIVANCVEYGSIISRMYCKDKAYNTITAMYCMQTVNVCAGGIYIETIGGIHLIVANCVEYSSIINRIYSKNQSGTIFRKLKCVIIHAL